MSLLIVTTKSFVPIYSERKGGWKNTKCVDVSYLLLLSCHGVCITVLTY
jgi:hypothetical protein